MPPLDFHRLAREEVETYQHRYTHLGAVLGRRFYRAFEEALDRVENLPQTCSPHIHGTRIAPLRKFPYWIVFAERPGQLYVLALMHTSRRPGYWRKRIRKP